MVIDLAPRHAPARSLGENSPSEKKHVLLDTICSAGLVLERQTCSRHTFLRPGGALSPAEPEKAGGTPEQSLCPAWDLVVGRIPHGFGRRAYDSELALTFAVLGKVLEVFAEKQYCRRTRCDASNYFFWLQATLMTGRPIRRTPSTRSSLGVTGQQSSSGRQRLTDGSPTPASTALGLCKPSIRTPTLAPRRRR